MAVRQNGTSGHPADERLAVLDDEYRRAVVEILAENDRSTDLTSLATSVVADVEGVSPDDVTGRETRRTKVELHHNHLPKLDDAGVLEYAHEEHRITPTADTETAQDLV